MIIWVLAGAMLCLAAGFICFRLWRPEKIDCSAQYSGAQMNKALYQQTVADLERQYPSGNESEKQALLVEAQRQLLADEQAAHTGQDQTKGQADSIGEKRSGVMLLAVSFTLMLLAVVLYARLGAMPDLQIRSLIESPAGNSSGKKSTDLRDALVKRLEQREDNFYYWLLLARIEQGDNHMADAVQAYRRARQLQPSNAAVAAELAQALFIEAGNRVDNEIESLVIEALNKNPHSTVALELAGIVAFSREDYSSAVTYWQRGLRFLHADSANAQALQAGITKAQSLLNSAGLAGDGEADGHANDPVLLSVDVELAKTLGDSESINSASTVFIYVREWQGPPMPLVAQRYVVKDLPLKVNFTDAMSLSPARKLSSVAQLEIIARISSSGSVNASSGDLEGRLGPLSINKVFSGSEPLDKALSASEQSSNPQSSYGLIIDQHLP